MIKQTLNMGEQTKQELNRQKEKLKESTEKT